MLLVAAESVFSRDGFKGAQMEEIAKAAGRSKGAIYAHYKSKDDLFMALYEHRMRSMTAKVVTALKSCSTRDQVLQALKKATVAISNDRTWILLTIEAKLYAIRHPEMRAQWMDANRNLDSNSEQMEKDMARVSRLLYGEKFLSLKAEIRARTVVIGPILEGLVLTAELQPKILTKRRLASVTDLLFDSLLTL